MTVSGTNLRKRAQNYLFNRVTAIDLLRSRPSMGRSYLKVGWCAPFLPDPTGGAAVIYWFVREMLKKDGVLVYAIPINGVIEKRKFPGIKLARLTDEGLDAVIFYCADRIFRRFADKIPSKKIVLQTVHFPLESYMEANNMIIETNKKADMVAVVSKAGREVYRKRGFSSLTYIPQGVDTELFRPEEPTSYFEVLYVSRLSYYKGIRVFLESIPIILREAPDVIFRIYGVFSEGDNYRELLQRKETQIFLEETKNKFKANVFYDGNWLSCDQMYKKYRRAAVLVFPSNDEGFGQPLIEAMSSGVPCIVGDRAPMNEIVRNRETGFCIPFRDGIEKEYHGMSFPHPEDIARNVLWLYRNPEERREMGVKARSRVENEYDIRGCVDKLLEVACNLAEKEGISQNRLNR